MILRCSSSMVLSRAGFEDLLKVMTLPTASGQNQVSTCTNARGLGRSAGLTNNSHVG